MIGGLVSVVISSAFARIMVFSKYSNMERNWKKELKTHLLHIIKHPAKVNFRSNLKRYLFLNYYVQIR